MVESLFILSDLLLQMLTGLESYDASPIPPLSGKLKGVLRPNRADVALVDAMINNRHISYQKVPGSPRETKKVIEVLGRQFFPFTRYSFQLATCVFVWTPASFFGVVSLKVDDATSSNGGSSEMKTEHDEVSRPEWSKNESWLEKLMRSVAISDPIEIQEKVKDSDESYTTRVAKQPTLDGPVNRLMSLALGALPRTSFFQHPHLFSGVTGTDKPWLKFFWGESIDESLNSGHNREITTRTAWSFTDNIHDATKPWPETLLIANVSKCSSVWEHAAYVTPMSHNRTKAEYVFPPGSQFKFCDSGEAGSQDAQPKKMRVVVLEALPSIKGTGVASDLKQVLEKGPKPLEVKDIQKLVQDKP